MGSERGTERYMDHHGKIWQSIRWSHSFGIKIGLMKSTHLKLQVPEALTSHKTPYPRPCCNKVGVLGRGKEGENLSIQLERCVHNGSGWTWQRFTCGVQT